MTLTRDFKETVNARIQREPEFATALLDEAVSLFVNGEPETARLILNNLLVSKALSTTIVLKVSNLDKNSHLGQEKK
jgi:hypothetical protein